MLAIALAQFFILQGHGGFIPVSAMEKEGFWSGSPARPMKCNGEDIAHANQCPLPLKDACMSKGVKAAHLEGPAQCSGKGWFCRIMPASDWRNNIWADPNFIYCNNTPPNVLPPLDSSGAQGHCHAATHDEFYSSLIKDHWFRGYAGTLHCCCDMGSLTGVTDRCDVKNGAQWWAGGEVHAGCGNPSDDPLYHSGSDQCWSIERFCDPARVPGYTTPPPAGLNDKYIFSGLGVAGPQEVWNVGDATGKGVQACYKAVMSDARCSKDYFTYVTRGDNNCGCKGSSVALTLRQDNNADYYQIQAIGTITTTITSAPDATTTTTPQTNSHAPVHSSDIIFLKTQSGNGMHIDVEGVAVRARWESRGNWQAIAIEKVSGGIIRSGDTVSLKTHTGSHIDIAKDLAQAQWNDRAGWQSMTITKKAGSGFILHGDIVCFKAHTGMYLGVLEREPTTITYEPQAVLALWSECGDDQAMLIEKEVTSAVFSGASIHMLAHTGKFIEVQGHLVQARWSERGQWQTFVIENYGGRAIFSGDAVFFKAHTGMLIDVQGEAVQARWEEFGNWQRLIIEKKYGHGAIMPGDTIFLRAHTGNMIHAREERVEARWHDRGNWQAFIIEESTVRRLAQTTFDDMLLL